MQQDQKWYGAFYAFWQKNGRVIWRVAWRILEFTGLIVAIFALVFSILAWIETRKSNQLARESIEKAAESNELAREAIADSRIAQSWQIVTTRAPGSSGKKQALERLYASGESLQGVDLSCQTMGGWDDEKQDCLRRTNLQDLNLAKTKGGTRANLRGVNFSYADMTKANLTGANMEWANLTDVDMVGADLTGAYMVLADLTGADMERADLTGAYMLGSTLTGAYMWRANLTDVYMMLADLTDANMWDANLTGVYMVKADLLGAKMSESNLSGAVFCSSFLGCAENLSQEQIEGAWAWADWPPVFKAGEYALELDMLRLCDPDLREAYEVNQEVGKPEGC